MALIPTARASVRVEVLFDDAWTVEINRPEASNSLTPAVVADLAGVLIEAQRAGIRVLALRGSDRVFCTGMDLTEAQIGPSADGSDFWNLLAAIRTSPVLVVSIVEALAAGGGVGLVAASDVVLATPNSTFSLPEALWGLMPCIVAPFLAERVGRRASMRMALLTVPCGASEAVSLGLVDRIEDDPEAALRRLVLRARRVDPAVQGRLKRFFADLPDGIVEAREMVLAELADVMASPLVMRNLMRFSQEGAYPWEV